MPRLKFRTYMAALLIPAVSLCAEEILLKPVAGNGAGEIVDGLQVSVQPVKAEFGPGESVMLHWTICNLGQQNQELLFDRHNRLLAYFDFEASRNGARVPLPREMDKKEKAWEDIRKTLAPGGKLDFWFDLLTPDFVTKNWLNTLGSYEIMVNYKGTVGGKPVPSGRISFKVAAATAQLEPPKDPEMAAQVRKLIAQLGADDFVERQSAQAKLIEIGRAALAQLKESLAGVVDVEIRTRCQKIIEEIEKQPRGRQHLCAQCLGKAFTADVGTCGNCRGFTPSGSWRFCQNCAQKLGQCAACGKQIGNPVPVPLPPIRPMPRPQPAPKPPQPPIDPAPPDEF